MSTPSRARRATAKVVNYAKEQEFSDAEDLFESEDDEPPKQQPQRTTKRQPRKAASTASNSEVADATTTTTTAAIDDIHQRPVYTEKGYDASLPPLRERFPFLPEYEEDGSPKIELIVGRRPIDEKEDDNANDGDGDEDEEEKKEEEGRRTRPSRSKPEPATPAKKNKRGAPNEGSSGKKKKGEAASPSDAIVEYEYLIKYKGKSYLHLDWKTGADLESMNRSAKGIYRRYLKKLAAGTDEDLENPEFDPSYVVPEKVLDEADQEVSIELTDKELLKWEKEREKELAEQGDDDDEEDDQKTPAKQNGTKPEEEEKGALSLYIASSYFV